MKKTYDTPSVVTSGSIVQETKLANQGLTEFEGKQIKVGSIGFNL